jgi:hypothetical protein
MHHVYRTWLAAILTAMMAAAPPPAAAQDEEQPRWFGSGYDDVATLAHGIPDSDYVALYFSCATGKPVVNAYVQDEESTAGEGTTMHVRLSAGGQQVAFSGKAMPNEDSGGKDVKGELPPDAALRAILTATGELEIVVDGHIQRYDMEGAAEPAAAMLAACDAPKPAGDLDVTVTNEVKRHLHSFAWSEAGVGSFDSDAFGYEALEPGASRTFTISGGRDICTFDLAVTFVGEDEEDCCSDPTPAGTQNLCENSTFVVHD